tara:strand:- start:617 stop:2341 length:1725 start_codon:yes stop_codon:yes gene_type:complete
LISSFFCLSANADLSDLAKAKLDVNQAYLCINVDDKLCNINNAFLDFNDYFEELGNQRKADNIKLLVDDDILVNKPKLKEALSTLKSITYGTPGLHKYVLSETLLTLIKFSEIEHRHEYFGWMTLNKVDQSSLFIQSQEGWNIWSEHVTDYGIKAKKFDDEYKDPFMSVSYQFAELGEHFVANAFQVKSTVPLAWKVSKATFLKAAKFLDAVNSIERSIDQVKHVGTFIKLIPQVLTFMKATEDSELTSDKKTAALILFETELELLKQNNASGIVHIINDVIKVISYMKQADAIETIKDYYPNDDYLRYPLNNSIEYLNSKMLVTMADLLQSISKVSGLTGKPIVGDLVDISLEAIKVFGNKDSIYRSSMLRSSLGEEYLHLRMEEMQIERNFFLTFSYKYWGKVVNKGNEIEKSRVNYYTPYLKYLSKSGAVDKDVNMKAINYKDFIFPYLRSFYPFKGRFVDTMSAACSLMKSEGVPVFDLCVENKLEFYANWEKVAPKRELIKLLSYQLGTANSEYTDIQHYIKLKKYKIFSKPLDVTKLDNFVLDANAMIWLTRTIFVKNDTRPIWWSQK